MTEPLRKLVSMRDALEDPALLGGAMPGLSWRPHRILLIAAMGEQLTPDEREIYRAITERDMEPGEQIEELVAVIGRRGGKTISAGCLAAFVSCLCDHSAYTSRATRPIIPVLAGSTTQANTSFQAILGTLEESPTLSKMIETSNTETIRMTNGCEIQVRPASWRTIRGITSPLICADEVISWQASEESANSDVEILNAVRPSLATTGGLLYMYSSPWAKRGSLYDAYKRNYGPNGKDPLVLVAKGPSKYFNPGLKQKLIDDAYERDAFRAAAEWGSEFRDGVTNLFEPAQVDAVTDENVFERPHPAGVALVAHSDMSGGRGDAATMAYGYNDRGTAIVCGVRERRPPFNPEDVIAEFADHLKSIGIRTVQIDRVAVGFNAAAWERHGVKTVMAPKSTSEMYGSLVSVVNSGQVRLVDNKRLHAQLCGLERRGTMGGREKIDHGPSGHDDLAASVSGLIHRLLIRPVHIESFAAPQLIYNFGDDTPSGATRSLY